MPEKAESAPQLNQFFLGVVDLFSILLPGAILTYWALTAFFWNQLPKDSPWDARNWTIFIVISYVAGHVISALGGIVLDKIYDRTYKLWGKTDGDYAHPNGRRAEYVRLRHRAKALAEHSLGDYYSDQDSVLSWSEALVRLSSMSAGGEIDHLEGESKFFRSLTVVLILGWPIYFLNAPGWWRWAGLASLVPVLILYIGMTVVDPLREQLKARRKEISMDLEDENSGKDEEDKTSPEEVQVQAECAANAELSWWHSFWALIAMSLWALIVVAAGFVANTNHSRALGIGCAALGVFSALRYMDKRLQRTALTYRYLIALTGI